MLSILKKELDEELTRGIMELKYLKEQLQSSVSDQNNPTNSEMVSMYNLRSAAK